MKKIKVFCSAGMSTSMLVKKMQEAAKEKGLEIFVEAYPEATLKNETDDCDIALLGPQVAFRLKAAQEVCGPKGIPVAVIPMKDFGRMNGKGVLEMALELKA